MNGFVGVPTPEDKLSGYTAPTGHADLLDVCRAALTAGEQGLDEVVLKVSYRPPYRGGQRVRIWPGVTGTVIGSTRGCLFVSVAIAAIARVARQQR